MKIFCTFYSFQRRKAEMAEINAKRKAIMTGRDVNVAPVSQNAYEDFDWVRDIDTEPAAVKTKYDRLATVYDKLMTEKWDSSVPDKVSSYMAGLVSISAKILDAGCGTGLSGQALHKKWYSNIHGCDISPQCLTIAEDKNVYAQTQEANLIERLPYPNSSFEGVICADVLQYIEPVELTLREFMRIVKPGGAIVFSYRTDLIERRDFNATLDEIVSSGLVKLIHVSENMPYLEGNPDFEGIDVVYYCLEVL
eukprot:TRINITY_DN1279_c0_g1_i3.p1 TRINITY_DN1279_c0_g1~~TRINITY_DN1279_c0_g1_i3.p1  ORF type:complete len:251 (-),score=48.77 TRINITY_DN1279_c0_g1_i3:24-776(-)